MADATVLWLRRDLRLADNPALLAAVRRGPVVPVALWSSADSREPTGRPRPGHPATLPSLRSPSGSPLPPGAASRWWRWHSLEALERTLRGRRSRLIVRRLPGAAEPPAGAEEPTAGTAGELTRLAREAGARAVVWAAGSEPGETDEDRLVAAALCAAGLEPIVVPEAGLLSPPGSVLTAQGTPFKVFTPFWRALVRETEVGRPAPVPRELPAPAAWPDSVSLQVLRNEAVRPWSAGFDAEWEPGEAGALGRLDRLLDSVLQDYADGRDRPDRSLTSRLSPHLHHGEVSARAVWLAVYDQLERRSSRGGPSASATIETDPRPDVDPSMRGAWAFLRQFGWREFAHHLLMAAPQTVVAPLRREFERFPWRVDPAALAAWELGGTGYPIVDAAMRQLWTTGWMHNRARLIVSSFLVKDLLLPWQTGAAWFWDTLVDADLANNTLGWQWMAGSGADGAPYFRILNPVAQGRRHDPEGEYVRRFVPELRRLPKEWIHAPWQAPAAELERAGVRLSETYPFPIVDHAEARRRALAAFDVVRGAAREAGKQD
jgi:deoxyribodipyrimidine photo-lyase